MIRIVLNDVQTKAITGVSEPIDLVDSSGRMLGRVAAPPPASDEMPELSPEELAEIKRRMANDDGTRYTTAEVLQHLRSLAPE